MPYEGMFVVYNKEAQKTHDYLEQHLKDVLAKVGATVVRLSKWDERQLAYEIQGQRDGIFYLCYFDAEGGRIVDLRREAELSELILRLLVLQLDEVPSEEEVQRRSGRLRKEGEVPGGVEDRMDGGGRPPRRERPPRAPALAEVEADDSEEGE